ncbi:MAG: 23S rRNA (cytidine(2498)-2'-O)-methyltransferase RlmM, partial [Pseudoxanthomonas sp.]
MNGLLCYCRQGFEPELAAELSERAALAGHPGYARTERNSAHVVFVCEDGAALSRALPWRDLIYARQKLQLVAELRDLDPKDRITPMLAALAGHARCGDLWVEHPDSDSAKPLAGLARS